MEILVIINTTVITIMLLFFAYKYNPFYISASRTFWCKKVKGYTLMVYQNESKTYAKGHFYLPIRNAKKSDDWDNKMFHSGEYKKYNN